MAKLMRKNLKRGFTLIEILLVLALLSTVMATFGRKVFSNFSKGNRQATALQIKQIEGALDRYRLDCGSYPSSEQGLEALIAQPSGGNCKDYDPSGYLSGKKSVPVDPWKMPYKYESTDGGLNYKITSFGEDKVAGGEGNGKDISSDDEK